MLFLAKLESGRAGELAARILGSARLIPAWIGKIAQSISEAAERTAPFA